IERMLKKTNKKWRWVKPWIPFDKAWEGKALLIGTNRAKKQAREKIQHIMDHTHIIPLQNAMHFQGLMRSIVSDSKPIHGQQRTSTQVLMNKLQLDLECEICYDNKWNIYVYDEKGITPDRLANIKAKLEEICSPHEWQPYIDNDADKSLSQLNELLRDNPLLRQTLFNWKQEPMQSVWKKFNSKVFFAWKSVQHNNFDLVIYGRKHWAKQVFNEIQQFLKVDILLLLLLFIIINYNYLVVNVNQMVSLLTENNKKMLREIENEASIRIYVLDNKDKYPHHLLLLGNATKTESLQLALQTLQVIGQSIKHIPLSESSKDYEVLEHFFPKSESKYNCELTLNSKEMIILADDPLLRVKVYDKAMQLLEEYTAVDFDCHQKLMLRKAIPPSQQHPPPLHLPVISSSQCWSDETFERELLTPLQTHTQTIISKTVSSSGVVFRILGKLQNVQSAEQYLNACFEKSQSLPIENKAKGLVLAQALNKCCRKKYSTLFVHNDPFNNCVHVMPLPLHATSNDGLVSTELQMINEDYRQICSNIGYAYVGNKLAVLLEENLPFELDTHEFIHSNEGKEDEEVISMDDSNDTSSVDSTANAIKHETRLDNIRKHSQCDIQIDPDSKMLFFYGNDLAKEIAIDLLRDLFQVMYIFLKKKYPFQSNTLITIRIHNQFKKKRKWSTCQYHRLMHNEAYRRYLVSQESILDYISKECQIKIELIQGKKEEIDAVNNIQFFKNSLPNLNHKSQTQTQNLLPIVYSPNYFLPFWLLSHGRNLEYFAEELPKLYIAIYGNDERRKVANEMIEEITEVLSFFVKTQNVYNLCHTIHISSKQGMTREEKKYFLEIEMNKNQRMFLESVLGFRFWKENALADPKEWKPPHAVIMQRGFFTFIYDLIVFTTTFTLHSQILTVLYHFKRPDHDFIMYLKFSTLFQNQVKNTSKSFFEVETSTSEIITLQNFYIDIVIEESGICKYIVCSKSGQLKEFNIDLMKRNVKSLKNLKTVIKGKNQILHKSVKLKLYQRNKIYNNEQVKVIINPKEKPKVPNYKDILMKSKNKKLKDEIVASQATVSNYCQ
ncbi:hypothetical protein RFI_08573, partial [Reticulomyxa filosa]